MGAFSFHSGQSPGLHWTHSAPIRALWLLQYHSGTGSFEAASAALFHGGTAPGLGARGAFWSLSGLESEGLCKVRPQACPCNLPASRPELSSFFSAGQRITGLQGGRGGRAAPCRCRVALEDPDDGRYLKAVRRIQVSNAKFRQKNNNNQKHESHIIHHVSSAKFVPRMRIPSQAWAPRGQHTNSATRVLEGDESESPRPRAAAFSLFLYGFRAVSPLFCEAGSRGRGRGTRPELCAMHLKTGLIARDTESLRKMFCSGLCWGLLGVQQAMSYIRTAFVCGRSMFVRRRCLRTLRWGKSDAASSRAFTF